MNHPSDKPARDKLAGLAVEYGLDVTGGKIRRTSSRFCLGVEHGDYNGTELFGVGTDRFIWLAYKPNDLGRVRLLSGNFPGDGVVEYVPGSVPEPGSPEVEGMWARFPCGVDWVLHQEGYKLGQGFDAVIYGDIPGGGMSRSASLTLNLILTNFELNGIPIPSHETGEVAEHLKIIDMAQAVENDYIGSPCGQLDQIMIYFARAGMGTHYRPRNRSIEYLPIGESAPDFRIVSLDTGTIRPGLETSTYRIRTLECRECLEMVQRIVPSAQALADIRDPETLAKIEEELLSGKHQNLLDRLLYIYNAQQRFTTMLNAWRSGDVATVGSVFRQDGLELRDLYSVSGPELETMCDIARTVPGVFGERMLGGGDKGASGAIVATEAVSALRAAVDTGYPRSHSELADRYAMHVCNLVDGITVLDGL